MSEFLLNNKWILWYHSIKNTNWDIDSYEPLYHLTNLYDYTILLLDHYIIIYK